MKWLVNLCDWIAAWSLAIFSSKARANAQKETATVNHNDRQRDLRENPKPKPTQHDLPEPLKTAVVVSCRKENRVIEHTCYTLKELAAYVTKMRERGFKITERSVDDPIVTGDNEDTGEKRDGDSEVTA